MVAALGLMVAALGLTAAVTATTMQVEGLVGTVDAPRSWSRIYRELSASRPTWRGM